MRPFRLSRSRARRGFARPGMTLIELSMALALSTGVALGIGYVVRQMTGAVISIEKRSEAQAEATLAVHRLRSELQQATSIVTLSAAKITFDHQDVTGDGQADLVSYAWAGTAGQTQPLTRTVNGGVPETLVFNCTAFQMTVAANAPTADRIAMHDRYAEGVVYSPQQITLTHATQAAELFTVTGSGAAAYRIDKVRVYLRRTATTGALTLELRTANSGIPTSTVLDEASRAVAQINSTGGWEEFQLNAGVALGFGYQYAIVLRTSGSDATVEATFDQITANPPGSSADFYRYTNTGGGAWSPTFGLGARDLKYYLYGRYLDSSGVPQAPAGGPIGLVEVHLETGTGASATILDAAVQCINNPELAG